MKKLTTSLYILLITLCAGLSGYAQTVPYTLDSTVGNLTFAPVMNAPYQSITLKELAPQNVLLVFWYTKCGTCVKEMKTLADLQKKYPKDLRVMMVTLQDPKEVQALFERRKELQALGLPTVTNDTALRQLFPYNLVPHIVWIGRDQRVKAITEAEHLTEKNVEAFIRSGTASLPLKKDLFAFAKRGTPLLVNKEAVYPAVVVSSTLTGAIHGIGGGIGWENLGSLKRVFARNADLVQLYSFAYRDQLPLPLHARATRIIYPRNHPAFFQQGERKPYCYELLLPARSDKASTEKEVYHYMRRDLDRLFSLTSRIEKRTLACYIVAPLDTNNKQREAKPYSISEFYEETRLQNVPAGKLAAALSGAYPFGAPVLYEGPAHYTVSTTLKNAYSSLEAIRSHLATIGYTLKKDQRALDVLVIK